MYFVHVFVVVVLTSFCGMSLSQKVIEGNNGNTCLKTLDFITNLQKEMCGTTSRLETIVQHLNTKTDKLEMELKEIKNKLASLDASYNKIDEIVFVQAMLEKNLTDTNKRMTTLQMQVDSKRLNIAFSARVSQSYGDINPEETIKFSDVLTNNGNAYNALTGIFTAPVTGTYMFFSSILTKNPSALEVGLQVNSQYKMMMYPDSRTGLDYNSGANSVILGLVEGDQVKMSKWGAFGARPFYIHHIWSTFSGSLIRIEKTPIP